MFTRSGHVKRVREKGLPSLVGWKRGGGDWLASKGLGFFFSPSNIKILSPHLLAFEMQVKTVELE